jgi:hypothetical protein
MILKVVVVGPLRENLEKKKIFGTNWKSGKFWKEF